MAADIQQFLRLQSDDYLTELRNKLAEDLLSNRLETSFSLNGKSGAQAVHVPVLELAAALAQVLEDKGLISEDAELTPRMTLPRFV